jgi:hypothetical protein
MRELFQKIFFNITPSVAAIVLLSVIKEKY